MFLLELQLIFRRDEDKYKYFITMFGSGKPEIVQAYNLRVLLHVIIYYGDFMKIIKIGALWCPACLITNNALDKINKNYDVEIVNLDYDLDEEEVPLDMAPFFEVEGSKSLSKAIKIALIITIIAAMSLTGAFIVWKKRLASKVGLLNKAGKKEPKVKEKTEK